MQPDFREPCRLLQVKIEKASIDEVYIDVTNIVETELAVCS